MCVVELSVVMCGLVGMFLSIDLDLGCKVGLVLQILWGSGGVRMF